MADKEIPRLPEPKENEITEEIKDKCTCLVYNWSSHDCPFMVEIHENYEYECTCCPYCERECSWEV